MKTFVLGDTHGVNDIKKLNRWYQREHTNLTKDDVLIQLGDWGALWFHREDGKKYQKDVELQIKWARKNFTTAIVPGNHENYTLINQLPIIKKWGGKVRVLTPQNPYNKEKDYGSIYLLERGEIYNINGQTILALGGAASQDKSMRVQNQSWWAEELWNEEQIENAVKNIKLSRNRVDYVVAHTCPDFVGKHILADHYSVNSFSGKANDPVAEIFTQFIKNGLRFKEWHFGHWHEDERYEKWQNFDELVFQSHFLNEPYKLGTALPFTAENI